MPLSSEEDRKKFLKGFGTSPQDVYQTDSDVSDVEEEQEETQELEASDTQEEPVAEEPAEEEEASDEVVDEEELVRLASERFRPQPEPRDEQSELDRLRQEVTTLKEVLGQTVASSEASLRDRPEPEPEPEDDGDIDWRSPEVARVLAQEMGLDEDQAASLAPVMGTVAEFVAEKKFGKKLHSLEEQISKKEFESQREGEMQSYWNNLSQGLQYAAQRGGIEGGVVKDFLENKDSSLLARHFHKFPTKISSPEGVLDAVVSVARSVQLMDVDEKSKPKEQSVESAAISGTKEEVLGAISKAKKSSSSKPKLTPEEEIKQSILNATRNPGSGIPKGFFG